MHVPILSLQTNYEKRLRRLGKAVSVSANWLTIMEKLGRASGSSSQQASRRYLRLAGRSLGIAGLKSW